MLFSARNISVLIEILSISLFAAMVHHAAPIAPGKSPRDSVASTPAAAAPPTPVPPANADRHFHPAARTGNNMIVLILTSVNPTINGKLMKKGDEIAAFNAQGVCVGANKWRGTQNTYVTVWGDNIQTPEPDGMKIGETILYRVWDSVLNKEYPARVTYHTKTMLAPNGTQITPISAGNYMVDGISVMQTLVAPAPQGQPGTELFSPADSSIITADSAEFIWAKGDAAADKYAITIAADSASNIIVRDTLTDTSVVYRKMKPGTVYWWSTNAHGIAGWGPGSAKRTFRILGH